VAGRLLVYVSVVSLVLLVAVQAIFLRAQRTYGVNPVFTIAGRTLWADNEELAVGTPHVRWSVAYVWIEAVLAAVPLLWIASVLRRTSKRRPHGRCPQCEYDLPCHP
jgi:hypothetical protein